MSAKLDCEELMRRLRHPIGDWREVDVHEQVDSTNVLAASDPSPWRIVVAAEQTAGRGRQGRAWASPPGTSVSMSMVVPAPDRPEHLGWVPLSAGLAVCRGLAGLTGRPGAFGVKWPNDVLADPLRPDAPHGTSSASPAHKVCGILCEVAAPGLVVVGIGVNVSAPPQSLPAAIAPQGQRPGAAPAVVPATSVRECVVGPGPTREQVIVAVAEQVARVRAQVAGDAQGRAALREAYASACVTLGREVEIHLPGGQRIVGRAESVDIEGKLVVRHADSGTSRSYAAGDVFHIRPVFGASSSL